MTTHFFGWIVILACLVCFCPARDLYASSGGKLAAVTSVRDQQVCFAAANEFQISMSLVVRFTNVGEYPIIIARNSVQSDVHIAHTERQAWDSRYEYGVRGDMWDFPIQLQPESPGDSWVIIKPGDAYERVMRAWGIHLNSPKEYDHYARVPHYIRIGFITVDSFLVSSVDARGSLKVDDPEVEEKQLRDRWKQYGDLWQRGADSQPLPLQLPAREDLKKCDREQSANKSG